MNNSIGNQRIKLIKNWKQYCEKMTMFKYKKLNIGFSSFDKKT